MDEIIEPNGEADIVIPANPKMVEVDISKPDEAAADEREPVSTPSEADEDEDTPEEEETPQTAPTTPSAKKHTGKRKRTLDIPQSITDGLAVSPVEYLRKWWTANSTAEEREAAEERDATIEGAYAFIEDFARRAKHKGGACLPDQLTYELCGIFMRICRDGDVYATAEEIAKDEEAEKKRKLDEAKRKEEAEKRRAQAAQKEAERLAAMSPEEREAYERELAKRSEKEREAAAEAERKRKETEAVERAKREKREAAARKKALAEEMEKRQLTFF